MAITTTSVLTVRIMTLLCSSATASLTWSIIRDSASSCVQGSIWLMSLVFKHMTELPLVVMFPSIPTFVWYQLFLNVNIQFLLKKLSQFSGTLESDKTLLLIPFPLLVLSDLRLFVKYLSKIISILLTEWSWIWMYGLIVSLKKSSNVLLPFGLSILIRTAPSKTKALTIGASLLD